jgi:hypothetical protein
VGAYEAACWKVSLPYQSKTNKQAIQRPQEPETIGIDAIVLSSRHGWQEACGLLESGVFVLLQPRCESAGVSPLSTIMVSFSRAGHLLKHSMVCGLLS